MTNDTLTAVPGIRVGHWTDAAAMTGCTVVVLPEPNRAAVEVRGAGPGTRETDLLRPGMQVEQIHAILLAGGSAFGLAAADGVMRGLAADGRGHPTPAGPVPIVPAAVVFDLLVGDGSVRPGPTEGEAAYRAAGEGPVAAGLVGAGTGTTVAKWRGSMVPGGLGSACVRWGELVVGALVVANGVGDVFTLTGEALTGGDPVPGPPAAPPAPGTNTTLAVVATNADLTRPQLTRVAVRGQDAYAACIRPVHTLWDGDTCFAASCGPLAAPVDLVAEAAFVAVGRAIEAAVRASAAAVP